MANAEPGYMSGPHDGPKCACRNDGAHWLKRCAAAAAEDRAIAARWAADHVRANPTTSYNVEYLQLAREGGLTDTRVPLSNNEDLR